MPQKLTEQDLFPPEQPNKNQLSADQANIKTILITEEKRYLGKGYGLITATLIAFTYFYLSPSFCKLVWPVVLSYTLERGWTELQLSISITLGWHYLWLVVANMSLYFVYHIEHPFFEKYKISKKPWPWQENKEEWRKTLKKSLKLVSFNSFVALPVTMIFFGALNNYQVPYALDVESIPDVPYFLINILFQIVCEDLLLHFIHKWLHHPRLYTLIHKKHHEYVQSVCIASQYTHPIEFILLSALPNGLIALTLGKRMHITTMLMYNFAREFETHDGHCGYEFSWMPFRLIPFSTSAAYHDFHHSHNVGNYSSYLTFWDTLFGENKDYYQNKQVQRRIFKQS